MMGITYEHAMVDHHDSNHTVMDFCFPTLRNNEEGEVLHLWQYFLSCPWCSKTPITMERYVLSTTVTSRLLCNSCNIAWYLCNKCPRMSLPLFYGRGGTSRSVECARRQKWARHINVSHGSTGDDGTEFASSGSDAQDFEPENSILSYADDIHTAHQTLCPYPAITTLRNVFSLDEMVDPDNLSQFVVHERLGTASQYLASMTCLGNTSSIDSNRVSMLDRKIVMLLLSLGVKISREDRNNLGQLLSLVMEREQIKTQKSTSCQTEPIPLPLTPYEMRRVFESGTRNISRFLPIPEIRSSLDGYADVCLVSTLKILFSRGIHLRMTAVECSLSSGVTRSPMSTLSVQEYTSKYHRTGAIGDELHIRYQPIVLWSDSAEVSKVKNNRSGIKVFNVCILRDDGQYQDSVFPLAVGTSTSDHRMCHEMIMREISELQQKNLSCLETSTGNIVKVRFFVNAIVQDRPEHSEFVCSIGHNGIFGALPGYSFPRHLTRDSGKRYSLKKDLVSCHICHRTRKRLVSLGRYHDASAPSRTCSRCHDWEILNVTFSSNGHLPTSLPQSCYVNCNVRKQLRSRKVSFETMLAALKHIFRLVYVNVWSDFSKTVRPYASLECINIALAKRVHVEAKQMRKLHVRNNALLDPPPDMPQHLIPKVWLSRDLTLDRYMVGIMHTLFLNGGKKIMLLILEVCKAQRTRVNYIQQSSNYFIGVRDLSLNWLRAWPLGGTSDSPLSQWVSENYVAFYHVSKSYITAVNQSFVSIEQKEVGTSLERLLVTWHAMLSVVMQPVNATDDMCKKVAALCRLFLTEYHSLEKYLNRESDKWDLQNSSCFLMLLLLPEYMAKFGCLRNYWEGGPMGERSITLLKKNLPHGAHGSGTMKSAVRRYFIDQALDRIMVNEHDGGREVPVTDDHIYDEGSLVIQQNAYERYRRFHVYRSRDTLETFISEYRPIACIYSMTSGEFFCAVWMSRMNDRRNRGLVRLALQDGIVHNGSYTVHLQIANASIDGGVGTFCIDDEDSDMNYVSVAALPIVTNIEHENDDIDNERMQTYYYMRTEHHTELISYHYRVRDGLGVWVAKFGTPNIETFICS